MELRPALRPRTPRVARGIGLATAGRDPLQEQGHLGRLRRSQMTSQRRPCALPALPLLTFMSVHHARLSAVCRQHQGAREDWEWWRHHALVEGGCTQCRVPGTGLLQGKVVRVRPTGLRDQSIRTPSGQHSSQWVAAETRRPAWRAPSGSLPLASLCVPALTSREALPTAFRL